MQNSTGSKYPPFTLNLHQSLMLFCIFSTLLSMVRVVATGERSYLFMIWNLFLAVVPYLISLYLFRVGKMGKLKSSLLLCLWMLFIPNTFYMLTDLFHLPKFDQVPQWFDLLLLLSFALNGMLLGIVSLRKIEIFIERLRGRQVSMMFVSFIMFLCSLGVYLGRFLRFNSWDLFTNPLTLFNEMFNLLMNPFDNLMVWGMICSYAAFMTLTYITIRRLGENLYSSSNKSTK